MPKIETITWRELTGNKFNRALHPAMLSDIGYTKSISVRRTGDAVKSYFNVAYDRVYVVEWLSRKICKSLFALGKQGTLDLISEAWDKCYGIESEKDAVAVTNS